MTRSVLSELVSHLMKVRTKRDNTKPTKRDTADLNKLVTRIRTTMDTFLTDFPDEKLYCISQVK